MEDQAAPAVSGRRRWRRALLLLVVVAMGGGVAVILVGDGDDTDQAQDTSAEAPVAAGAARAGEEEERLARAGLLRLDDLPTGWREGEETEDDEDPFEGVPECQSFSQFRDHPAVADVESPNFVLNDDEVSNLAAVATTPEVLDQYFATAEESLEECLQIALRAQVEANIRRDPQARAEVDDLEVSVGRMSFPSFGLATLAWQVEMAVEAGGLTFDFTFDIVLVRVHPNAIAVYFFTAIPAPFLEDQEELVRVTVERLERALAPEG